MLINMRNGLMAGKRLPYDAEVEYLESTGTQWIDTRYRMTSDDMRFECDMMWKSAVDATANFFYGYRFVSAATTTGNMRTFFLYWDTANGKTAIRYGVTGGLSSSLVNQNTRINVAFDGTALTVDGTEYNAIASASASPAYGNMYLFDCNTGSYYRADVSRFAGRIYYFKIWQGNVLVRDFIPVRKGTVGYLYDRVSGKLFGNEGTGDFVLGPDVVPVEYIESHGTEYVDLGTIVPPDADFEFTGSIVSDMTNGCIFGETNAFSWGNGNPGYSLVLTSGGRVYMRYGDNTSTAIGLTTIGTGNTFTASLSGTSFRISGQSVATIARISGFAGTVSSMGVFRRNIINGFSATFSAIRLNNLKFGNLFGFRPVRVGTDATSWEGAMMDVLTRRIYRNAGTGAFGYGNDRKYPIPAE